MSQCDNLWSVAFSFCQVNFVRLIIVRFIVLGKFLLFIGQKATVDNGLIEPLIITNPIT